MSLRAAATAARAEAIEVRGMTSAIGRAQTSSVHAVRTAARGPKVTVLVGGSAVDRQAADNYLSIFTNRVPLTLPGYGIDPTTLTPGHGFDPASGAFYLALFTIIRRSPEAAHGLRL